MTVPTALALAASSLSLDLGTATRREVVFS